MVTQTFQRMEISAILGLDRSYQLERRKEVTSWKKSW